MEKYYNFDLWIERTEGERFRASVVGLDLALGLGEADEAFEAPFVPGQLEDLLNKLRQPLRDLNVAAPPSPLPRKIEEEIGRRLFRAVFQGKVEQFWRQARLQAQANKAGLRLRLRIADPELTRWPWEFLFDPETGFLALSEVTPIIRYTEMAPGVRASAVKLPLRILVVTSHPFGCPPLQVEEEWREVREALKALRWKRKVVLERVDRASLSALHLKLQEKPFQILHFIGHGSFERDEGVLHLEQEGEGVKESATGGRLAEILKDHSSLQLVVLNACEGGIPSLQDPFGGVAQALVQTGVPAVLAMRSKFSDAAAVFFSRAFYSALACGKPVDAALSMARKGLFSKRPDSEWAVPVLYSRQPEQSAKRSSIPRIAVAAGLTLMLAALGWESYLFFRDLEESLERAAPDSSRDVVTPLPLGPQGSSRGCPTIEGLGIQFARIDPGTFTMGEASEGKDTEPHEVTLAKPFCMSLYEITQEQWQKIMRENPSEHTGQARLPVERVTWNAAQDFLHELSALDLAANFRLPSEAQWEYAARGKKRTRFSFGNDPNRLPEFGNCRSTKNDGFDGPAPVGSFKPNDWGLYDMHGNVSEWVEDWYTDYGTGSVRDPAGPREGTERVRRGGSYEIIAKNCGSAKRNQMKPDHSRSDVGFRIVRNVVD